MNDNPRRKDPRTEATRKALIEAGELLFGHFGFETVTMRQIGTAIGSKNKVVVAYHFGSKIELIDAIYRERLPLVEARRAELLADLRAHGLEGDLRQLMVAMWQPLAEITNSENIHSFALFLGKMVREDIRRTQALVRDISPTTRELVDRINLHLPPPGPVRDLRWQLSSRLVLDAIRILDEDAFECSLAFPQVLDEAIAMAVAALVTPSSAAPAGAAG